MDVSEHQRYFNGYGNSFIEKFLPLSDILSKDVVL